VNCVLQVSNMTASASGPLRVRLVIATVHQLRGQDPVTRPPSPDEVVDVFGAPTNSPLASNRSWSIPVTGDVFCRDYDGDGDRDGLQYHLDAILEEQTGERWVVVDRLRIFSSVPGQLFPPNEGVTGSPGERNYNQFIYALSLSSMGPVMLDEGAQGQFMAAVRLSDNSTQSVAAVWTVNQPHTIDASGLLTVGDINMDSVINVNATYTRTTQTLTALSTVELRNSAPPDPPTIANPRREGDELVFDLSGLPGRAYRIFAADNLKADPWTFLVNVTTDAGGHAVVRVPTSAATRYFQAAP